MARHQQPIIIIIIIIIINQILMKIDNPQDNPHNLQECEGYEA